MMLKRSIHYSNSHNSIPSIRRMHNEIFPLMIRSIGRNAYAYDNQNSSIENILEPQIRSHSTLKKRNNYIKEASSTKETASPQSYSTEKRQPLSARRMIGIQKNIVNEKRLDRSHKRQPREILRIKEDQELMENYKRQRNTIVENFSNSANIKGLFSLSKPKVVWGQVSKDNSRTSKSNYSELTAHLTKGTGINYYNSEMQNTLNTIANHFVNSVLVEINIRKVLADRSLDKYPDCFLYRHSLMSNIKDEKKKNEILKILVQLYNRHEYDDPSSFDYFFQNLDRATIHDLMNKDILESDSFNSVEFYRHNFNHFKSSQYLNYDHSDTLRFVQSSQPVKFKSPERSNVEYYEKLDPLFENYNAAVPLSHISLILSVSRILISCQKYTPTISIFNYLLNKFGEAGLYNYQSIVYDNLPSYRYKQTVLATPVNDSLKAPKMGYHFQDMIEEDPQFLNSLIDYQVSRNDKESLKELLSFYRFDEISAHEKALMKTSLKSLVSKSRFSKFRSDLGDSISFNSESPIFVLFDSIYSAINACIELKQYEFIDLLVSKLILHSVEVNNKIKVALTFGKESKVKSDEYSLLVSQELSIYDLSSKIFTKEVFILLLRACRESDDLGRLMWLTPHLDFYLSTNLEDSKKHLEKIKHYLNKLIVRQSVDISEIKEFIKQDSLASIDSKLIASIHETFSLFGIDGKLLKYDEFLDFKHTSSTQVNLTKKAIDDERENIKKHGGKLNLNHYLDDLYFYLNPAGEYGDDPTKKTYRR